MENPARRCCLSLLAMFLCVSLISCTEQQFLDYQNTDKYSSTRQDSTHHSIEKRPTVLLNRLMYALQNAIHPASDSTYRKSQMELERRGSPRNYWKCYFNAVTCFRRKREIVLNGNSL